MSHLWPANAPHNTPSAGPFIPWRALSSAAYVFSLTETDKKLLMWLEKQRVVPSAMRMQEVGRLAPGVFEVTG